MPAHPFTVGERGPRKCRLDGAGKSMDDACGWQAQAGLRARQSVSAGQVGPGILPEFLDCIGERLERSDHEALGQDAVHHRYATSDDPSQSQGSFLPSHAHYTFVWNIAKDVALGLRSGFRGHCKATSRRIASGTPPNSACIRLWRDRRVLCLVTARLHR